MPEEIDLFGTLKDDYREALEQFNEALVRLENRSHDSDSLDVAGRQLHNIKGLANRMGAPKLGKVAHILEDVLTAVHRGQLPFDEVLGELLFQGLDLFVHYLRSREVPGHRVAALVEQIELRMCAPSQEEPATEDLEALLPDFIVSACDNVEAINQGLVNLGNQPSDRETLQHVYRNAHSLKGSA
ncbi:MAG: Hpt domain-containing protein, partial [Syntrophobacteria bacterium]